MGRWGDGAMGRWGDGAMGPRVERLGPHSRGLMRCHQWSSMVINGHQLSSMVIQGHPRSSGVVKGSSRVVKRHQACLGPHSRGPMRCRWAAAVPQRSQRASNGAATRWSESSRASGASCKGDPGQSR
eukprot:7298404-Prymnesium_polylepis.1